MNILYISPYRNNEIQNECINNIKVLHKKASINISPIYLNNNISDPDGEIIALESQNLCDKEYDIVVQHAPIDYLIPFKNITKRNYCIPILKYSKQAYLRNNHHLLSFDMILADSKYDADFISSTIGSKSKKIKLFNYTYNYQTDKTLNLLHHKNNYKLYTIINTDNFFYLYNMLLSFFVAYQDLSNCSFILCASSEQVALKIQSTVDELVQKTKIKYAKNYLNIVTITNNIDDILSVHQTCDCYIELRSNTNSHFNIFIAKENNNAIISNENLDITYEPILSENNGIDISYPIFSISSLANKIKNIVRTKSIHKLENIPTIDKVICN